MLHRAQYLSDALNVVKVKSTSVMSNFLLGISNVIIVTTTAVTRLGSEGPKKNLSVSEWSMRHRHNEVIMTVSGHGRCREGEFIVIVNTHVNVDPCIALSILLRPLK